jgi:phosphoserine phosphatase RsbU/P
MPNEDILIVDDTPTNLSLLTQMLAAEGYAIRAATSGPRALESARALPPDLILLDVRMPGLNGFEVCQELKSDARTREIPVIFISALDDIQDKVQGLRSGGVDYITKPFQLEEVLARTETHLAMRALQRKLEEANRKMTAELVLAGQLQANFMPSRLPCPEGWQIAACLHPARETSGDFFDVFTLPDGRLAVLIADVVDKGVGAALFMVYTWSLIRTYADERPEDPAWVFNQVNRRILADTVTDQFVTLFMGLIDPKNSEMIYCNAGHIPPLYFKQTNGKGSQRLLRTGIPLGIFEDQHWQQLAIKFDTGDLLVLYTDGITDAINPDGENFGEKRLFEATRTNLALSAQQVQDAIVARVKDFAPSTPQFDDIALVVIKKTELE